METLRWSALAGTTIGCCVKLRLVVSIEITRLSLATFWLSDCIVGLNDCGLEPRFVSVMLTDCASPGSSVSAKLPGAAVTSRLLFAPAGRAAGPCAPSDASAAYTAASALIRPAPCSYGGAPRSVAVLMTMRLMSDGSGDRPPCVLRYAWITSATSPATKGAASLVPPLSWIGDGIAGTEAVRQPVNKAVFVEHSAQP